MKLDDECQVNKYSNWMRMNTLARNRAWGDVNSFGIRLQSKAKLRNLFWQHAQTQGPVSLSPSLIWPDPLYPIPIHKSYGNLRENIVNWKTMEMERIYRKGKIVRQDLDLDRRYANYKLRCLCVCAAPALCSHKSLLFLLLFKFKNLLLAWSVSSDRWWLYQQQLQHLLEIHYNCEPTLSLSLWAVTDCFVISAYSEKWDTPVSVKAPANFAVNLAHSPRPSLSLSPLLAS